MNILPRPRWGLEQRVMIVYAAPGVNRRPAGVRRRPPVARARFGAQSTTIRATSPFAGELRGGLNVGSLLGGTDGSNPPPSGGESYKPDRPDIFTSGLAVGGARSVVCRARMVGAAPGALRFCAEGAAPDHDLRPDRLVLGRFGSCR